MLLAKAVSVCPSVLPSHAGIVVVKRQLSVVERQFEMAERQTHAGGGAVEFNHWTAVVITVQVMKTSVSL